LRDVIADPVRRSADRAYKRLARLASPDPTRSSKDFSKRYRVGSLIDADQTVPVMPFSMHVLLFDAKRSEQPTTPLIPPSAHRRRTFVACCCRLTLIKVAAPCFGFDADTLQTAELRDERCRRGPSTDQFLRRAWLV
jgi:hypothetical protein